LAFLDVLVLWCAGCCCTRVPRTSNTTTTTTFDAHRVSAFVQHHHRRLTPCTLRGRPPTVIYICACGLLVASGIVRCPTSDPDGAWQCRPSGLSVAKLHQVLHSAIPTLGNAHKFPEACLPAHDASHSEGTRRNKLLLDSLKAICSFA
jgi:hypothetical protein